MVLGPADRVGVLERPVLGVDAVNVEADLQAARGQIPSRPDIVAGEEVDG